MSDDTPTARVGTAPGASAYRVLARKYRPSTFAEMIGQDALVRTLTNAMTADRLAHAFILTGVRGVGKTTTARIIARALNCVGRDGNGGPTIEPCGDCEPCRSIAADRNVDVLEMDAASRTGVDDIRELIDGVRYGPVAARYKVYIIDEVHMLSKNAFNALLKTLEEPPAHAKFIFATTEVRKVPVTVLSRCQRFDLRRIDADLLADHFTGIAEREAVAVEPEAIALIARAADGSARDGLSLLDQAIAEGAQAGGAVTAAQVRDMLGLADRIVVIDLFEALLQGKAAPALDLLADLHRSGADPLVVLQDLLDFCHFLTRVKLVPEAAESAAVAEAERVRGAALAGRVAMPVLTRAWQMLLKGLDEVRTAPKPQAALEMVLIRLIHAAGLPTPGEVIAKLEAGGYGRDDGSATGAGIGAEPAADPPTRSVAPADRPAAAEPPGRGGRTVAPPTAVAVGAAAADPAEAPRDTPAEAEAPSVAPAPVPADFRGLVELFAARADARLHSELYLNVHPVRYEPGLLEFRPRPEAPSNLANRVAALLQDWTGRRWVVGVSGDPGEPTLREQDRAARDRTLAEAADHPTVRAVLRTFPGARIATVRDLTDGAGAAEPAEHNGEH
ncbi:MAG: DNA polymerase III subunit gamma/tau [Alphaproteobacteria bacterium]